MSTSTEIYFGKGALNRLSFMRADPQFISRAITSPYAKLIFMDQLAPVVDTKSNKLFALGYNKLERCNRVLINQWTRANEQKNHTLLQSPVIHFLGLGTAKSRFQYNQYEGTPYFAVEIDHFQTLKDQIYSHPNLEPLPTRELVNLHLDYEESTIFAQAKMFLQWITTTPHCRGCGSRTVPIHAGSELKCTGNSPCAVRSAPVSNASFPRLDPVLITCVINESKDQVLFTRHSKFPKGMYTHIAGFIEPGETVESAVKREVWEESGLTVNNVQIVRTQPWPYPTNIMLGCVAIVDGGDIHLGHDLELEEAFWCNIKDLKQIIQHGKEDQDMVLRVPHLPYGIPNDKTLATKLYQYVVEQYA